MLDARVRICVVGLECRVVRRLGNDRLVLCRRVRRGLRGLESRQIERRRGRAGHLELHDRAGVRPVAGQRRRRAAGRRLIGIAGVVVVARIERRNRRGRVVVEDELRSGGNRGEVDDDVGALGRAEHQRVGGDVQHDDVATVEVVTDRRVLERDRRGQDPAVGSDLHDVGPDGGRVGNPAVAAVGRPGGRITRRLHRGDHGHLTGVGVVQRAVRVPHRRVRLRVVQLQVERSVVGRVQDLEAVRLRRHAQRRVRGAVHERRVHERFRHLRRVGSPRVDGPFLRRRARERIRHRTMGLSDERRPEPGAVIPAAHVVRAAVARGVLVGHVDVGEPQIAEPAVLLGVPRRVLLGQLGRTSGRTSCPGW